MFMLNLKLIKDVVNEITKNTSDIEQLKLSNVYSTKEIVIGTYFDKPRYRRTIISTTGSTVQSWKSLTNGLNAKKILKYEGFIASSSTEQKTLPFGNGTSFVWFQRNGTGEFQEAHNSADFNSKEIEVTIEYTKTTD